MTIGILCYKIVYERKITYMEKEILNVDEACELLSISRRKLYKLKKEGLPYIKLGGSIRFDKEKVLEWVRQFEVSDK